MPRDDTQDIPEYYGWKLFHIDRKIRKLPYSEIINPTKKSRKKFLHVSLLMWRFHSHEGKGSQRFAQTKLSISHRMICPHHHLIILNLSFISLLSCLIWSTFATCWEESACIYQYYFKIFYRCEEIYSRIYCEYKYNGLNY